MRAAFDTGLNHHVDRAADDDQMLDVVAPHQHQPLLIDDRGLDHAEPASRAAASSRSLTQGEALDPPGGERDQRHHEQTIATPRMRVSKVMSKIIPTRFLLTTP